MQDLKLIIKVFKALNTKVNFNVEFLNPQSLSDQNYLDTFAFCQKSI